MMRLLNLGPIARTDIFAKIATGFVAKWVVHDIENNIAVKQFTFGNVQCVSTTSHYLVSLLHHLYEGSDKCNNIGTRVLSTDISKAFDLVIHVP